MRLLKPLLLIGVSALVAHLLWSAVIVGFLGHYYSHRLINIRKMENIGNQWQDMSSAFVTTVLSEATIEKKPLVLFIGSSVTFGYPWQERVIFSRIVSERFTNLKVANLSVIGADMSKLNDYVTCSLVDFRKPSMVLAEIPMVNSIGQLTLNAKRNRGQCANYSNGGVGYWRLVLSRPYGLGWISLLWDEESYEKPDEDIAINPLPSTYFASAERFDAIRPQYETELAEYLNAVSAMGRNVAVYVSPIYTPGIGDSGGDKSAVEHQIELTYNICKRNGKVICLDSSSFGTHREYFYNLTHLNQRGHQAMAEWFEQQILKYQ
jgi:hypothetical protein